MASFPVEVLLGVYLGLLTGVVPALVAWALGFSVRYVTGVSIPGFGVVVLGLALAGAQGGLLALADPSVTQSESQVRLTVALLVVISTTLYTHNAGDKLGARLPKRLTLRSLRERTLSADVIERVGRRGEVRVTVAGDVADLEGYPPVPEELRAEIREGTWTFPADLPLSELETRVEAELREEFDLPEVSVTLDERANASVAAAPPAAGLSRHVPPGRRGVSVRTLVPTGLATGDEVRLAVGDRTVEGTVVAVRTDVPPTVGDGAPGRGTDAGARPEATGDTAGPPAAGPSPSGGGEPAAGRVTVALDRESAERVLGSRPDRLTVLSRGTRREFELVGLLRRAGSRFRRLTVAGSADVAGQSLREAAVGDIYGVAVLAVRHDGRWVVAPDGDQTLSAGDDLFAVGPREALDRFEGVAA
jgi:hypothetical protein